MPEPFVLGVNYWPRRKAMYWWSDFDRSEVADDFDLIADLGMSVVRLFLLWDDWQPDPTTVAAGPLGDLGVVCDLAGDRDLQLDITFFTGHMSGPNWAPRWLLDRTAPLPSPHARQTVSRGKVAEGAYRNMFHDPTALAASRLLLRTVVGEYADHDAVWLWNLGNEPDLFAYPSDAAEGRAWVREMGEVIGELDPSRAVTCGLHMGSLVADNGLRIDHVFAEADVAVIHGYPMYVPWSRHDLDPDFVPFVCSLTSALAGKPCLVEEWGACTVPGGGPSTMWEWVGYEGARRRQFMAGEDALAEYVEAVLPKLIEVGSTGALLWCFADYAEELWDRPPCDPGGSPHERHFGLVRPDGTTKPHADIVRAFAATRPTVQPASRDAGLDVSADVYYRDPARHVKRLYRSYVERHGAVEETF